MTLWAFVDDSGDENTYAVGGYIAPIGVIEKLSADWSSVCNESPPIEYYRTHDAITLSQCFSNWEPEVRDAKVAKLASVIPIENCYGITTHFSPEDLKEIGEFVFRYPYDNPYFSCVACLIALICTSRFPFLSQASKLDFFFDERGKIGKQFQNLFDILLKPIFLPLGNCYHLDDRQFPPLQTADMNAAWIRNHESHSQMLTSADIFLSHIKYFDFRINRDFLGSLGKGL